MRMRFPTCRSVGFGCFLTLIFFLLSSRDVYGGCEGSAMYRACPSFDPNPSVGLSFSWRKNLKSGIQPDARLEFGFRTRRLLTRLFETIGGPRTSGNGSHVGFCGSLVIIGHQR